MQHKIIAQQTHLSEKQVASVIQLLEGGATIPFIARYRKESTGSLDEVKIAEIKNQYESSQLKSYDILNNTEDNNLKNKEENLNLILDSNLNSNLNSNTNENTNENIVIFISKKEYD